MKWMKLSQKVRRTQALQARGPPGEWSTQGKVRKTRPWGLVLEAVEGSGQRTVLENTAFHFPAGGPQGSAQGSFCKFFILWPVVLLFI